MIRTVRAAAVAALVTLLPAAAAAQAQHPHGDMHAQHHPASGAPHMKTACPLHLATLSLTPVQDSALVAIRRAHMAEMEAVRALDTAATARAAAMQASMGRATSAVRATLTPAQRATFDAAVAAHEAEKQELQAKGIRHDCAACCRDHGMMHGAGPATQPPKKP